MSDVVISIGEHRNEKSAAYLGRQVIGRLADLGHNPILEENPETRTLLEILKSGSERVGVRRAEQMLYGWGDKLVPKRYRKIPIFSLHNWNTNPTQFEDGLSCEVFARERADYFPPFDNIPALKGNPLANLVYLDTMGDRQKIILVEIPHIQQRELSEEDLEVAKKAMTKAAFGRFSSYLLSTEMDETKAKGWVGDEILDVLATGIDYLIRNDPAPFFD